VTIEILQFLLGNGHTSTVDDVLLNTLGAVIGYIALLLAAAVIRRLPRRAEAPPDRARGIGSDAGP
jgi:glycopeptide antibiotics resistance protein